MPAKRFGIGALIRGLVVAPGACGPGAAHAESSSMPPGPVETQSDAEAMTQVVDSAKAGTSSVNAATSTTRDGAAVSVIVQLLGQR